MSVSCFLSHQKWLFFKSHFIYFLNFCLIFINFDFRFSASPGDVPIICGWSERLRLGTVFMADGSLVFLQAARDGYLVTKRTLPVTKYTTTAAASLTTGDFSSRAYKADNDSSSSTISQELISKIHCMKMVDSANVCGTQEILLAAVLFTKVRFAYNTPLEYTRYKIQYTIYNIKVTVYLRLIYEKCNIFDVFSNNIY